MVICEKCKAEYEIGGCPCCGIVWSLYENKRAWNESKMDVSRMIEVMKMISEDVEKDAENFDDKPFDGKTMAEYMGNHGAAIKALARAIIEILVELRETKN